MRGFNLAAQADAVARFRELDSRFAELTRLYIRAKLAGRIPEKDGKASSNGYKVLKHQLALKKGSIPVRRLVEELGSDPDDLGPLSPHEPPVGGAVPACQLRDV